MDITLIKFRGYNIKNKMWLYGSLIKNRNQWFVTPDEFADGKTWEDYLIDPASVGQFTCAIDILGNEIYSGHIVSVTSINNNGEPCDDVGVVEFDSSRAKFVIRGNKGNYNLTYHSYGSIIGDNYKPLNND